MSDKSADYLKRLLDADDVDPALRKSYQRELDAMLHPAMTPRAGAAGGVIFLLLAGCTVLLVRNLLYVDAEPLARVSWAIMAIAFGWVAWLIARDMWRRTHSAASQLGAAKILTGAAGTITAASLLMGLSKPENPESLFSAFFVFVFYFACVHMSVENRIAAAELASREQMLRIEYRLASIAERSTNG
jgi:hypothetical protein